MRKEGILTPAMTRAQCCTSSLKLARQSVGIILPSGIGNTAYTLLEPDAGRLSYQCAKAIERRRASCGMS